MEYKGQFKFVTHTGGTRGKFRLFGTRGSFMSHKLVSLLTSLLCARIHINNIYDGKLSVLRLAHIYSHHIPFNMNFNK